MDKILEVALSNRFKCSLCKETIKKDEKLFRDEFSGWRASHNTNVCERCLIKMFLELNVSNKQLNELRKEKLYEEI